ncbi:hypothetical protein MKQ70_25365 [Chitinophaga sedimenti]|uniref:hypothetical protein n=1 Tax=Chitinophaga sedimenti TaxID=2033606 RepID=UPI002006543E|nr:hypothetical protein [Chitinophaga sedimenti]MCK7558153.1 hypothetical protein [Chitinophaga sedimenti]
MKKLFPKSLLAIVLCCSAGMSVSAQQKDTLPTKQPEAVPLDLDNPQQYEIADIAISGTQFLDKQLLISLSGLNVGDKVILPGDHFRKQLLPSGRSASSPTLPSTLLK